MFAKPSLLGDLATGLSEGVIQGDKMKQEHARLGNEIKTQEALTQYRMRQIDLEKQKAAAEESQFGQTMSYQQDALKQKTLHESNEDTMNAPLKQAETGYYNAHAQNLRNAPPAATEADKVRAKAKDDISQNWLKLQGMWAQQEAGGIKVPAERKIKELSDLKQFMRGQYSSQGIPPEELDGMLGPVDEAIWRHKSEDTPAPSVIDTREKTTLEAGTGAVKNYLQGRGLQDSSPKEITRPAASYDDVGIAYQQAYVAKGKNGEPPIPDEVAVKQFMKYGNASLAEATATVNELKKALGIRQAEALTKDYLKNRK